MLLKLLQTLGYATLLILSACQSPKTPPSPPATATPLPVLLQVGVTESAGGLADLLPPAYHQLTQQATLQLITGNEDALFADIEAGVVDAILLHVPPANGSAWFINPVAVDGLVILVHPENPVTDLNLSQLQAIFSGRIRNWAEVGGLAQPIVLFSREIGAGSWTVFQDRVMQEQRLTITAIVQGSDKAIQEAVGRESAGIGYSMMGNLQVSQALPLSISHTLANPTTTASQTYPLTVPLYFLSPSEPTGQLRAFLAWIQSSAGQTLLSTYYGTIN